MKNFSSPLIEKTKEYVGGIFAENFSEKICYHNIDHTLDVVEGVQTIAADADLGERDLEILIIAAWFHDTGYFLGPSNHEKSSAELAAKFLVLQGVDNEIIFTIQQCILSTCMPQKPTSILEKIMCDADLFHLGSESFLQKNELLLHELTLQGESMTLKNWLIKSQTFLATHKYHTTFAQDLLEPVKKENINKLQYKILESGN